MDIPAILTAIDHGGAAIIELVIIWFLWRELTRSRAECESQMKELRHQQLENIKKISHLEGKIYTSRPARIDHTPEKVIIQQPIIE